MIENGVHDEVCKINHITLFSLETFEENAIEEIKKYVEEIAQNQNSVSISFNSVGTFMSDINAVFLNPTMTSSLMTLQQKVGGVLSKYDHKIFYTTDKWTPHSTIAINLTDEEFIKAFEVLKKSIELPINAIANQIIITQYDVMPGKIIAEYGLKNQ